MSQAVVAMAPGTTVVPRPESALRRFIRDKGLAWPQHFDGKGWENRFAQQYGIFSIPTMWLVDRQGKLRSTEVRGGLASAVQTLLEEHQ